MTEKSFTGETDLFGLQQQPKRIRGAGGVAFVARDLRDVLRELGTL